MGKTIAYILIDTGCRRGEVMGLKWECIDLDSEIITIERALLYTPATGIIEGPPKNGESRTIRIAPETVSLLRAWREEQNAMRRSVGKLWTETGYNFYKRNRESHAAGQRDAMAGRLFKEARLAPHPPPCLSAYGGFYDDCGRRRPGYGGV